MIQLIRHLHFLDWLYFKALDANRQRALKTLYRDHEAAVAVASYQDSLQPIQRSSTHAYSLAYLEEVIWIKLDLVCQ